MGKTLYCWEVFVVYFFISYVALQTKIELVKDFHCFEYSTNSLNCSWLPTDQSPEDLNFYYWYPNASDTIMSDTIACSNYLYSAGKKTGCLIFENFPRHLVYLQVNGTVNGSSIRNIFDVVPLQNVKPPPPKVLITERGNVLYLSWNKPNLSDSRCWKYILNYTNCEESHTNVITTNSCDVPYDSTCQYRFQIQAVYGCSTGKSDWSEVETFGEVEWLTIVIAILIPVLVFFISILCICCFIKHRERIFPKIPQPSISKEQKNVIGNLYVPVENDVECKFSLEKSPTYP
ncbi:hypothetical protein DPEC_G00103860 [Dallia pectoralis]|uniref:Uncharacterized protein n=1 Tax=Dallia pectoralis TaxID=75939 RepID=A0ACC2GXA4_DALPE|nr:hypothetical protein DPEC_G00103860 [Dallia pectoralis]